MTGLPAKHLLIPVPPCGEDAFFHADWNMNLYRGCCHGCIYCDSRSACYHIEDFEHVQPKQNALGLLEEELRGKRRTGVVSMGSMSDPYNPLERTLCLTRGALELLRRYRFGVSLTTKSALCTRDADVLADIARHAPAQVQLSITCAEDALCRRIEPHVSPSSERFAALRTLIHAGVYAGVWLNPVLPFITDTPENILAVVHQAAEAGAKFVVCFFGMTLRTGNREYYFDALQQAFPGVRQKYLSTFGNAYSCDSPRARELFRLFRAECERLGLAWRFQDINRAAQASVPRQLSLWDG
ncbi:MAG: SPL family radical SAM protein [Aristaeellaceae bacterium]